MYEELTTPAVVINLDVLERNIRRMADNLAKAGVAHRPHIKNHKSLSIARKQLEAGAIGITVAKLAEAEVFAKEGFDHILIAYPIVGDDKLARFAELHRHIDVLTTVDSVEVAAGLSSVGEKAGKPVRVLIEIDGGLHRCGVQPGRPALDFALRIRSLPGIDIIGIMGYFGQIYDETTLDDVRRAVERESSIVKETVSLLEGAGFGIKIVSTGSTPASMMVESLAGATEVRAGNYAFNDASSVQLGLAGEEDCALRVVVTVVSTPLPGRATIDAGTKTLTSDKAHHREGYGLVVDHPEIDVVALNEEHGMLSFDPARVNLHVGQRLEIIPNHACVIPNLNEQVHGVRQGRVVESIRVDARGCNY